MVKEGTYTIVVNKQGTIISVTKNGLPMTQKPGNEGPNFGDLEAPIEFKNCVGLGGIVVPTDSDACEYRWGTWW